MKSSTSNASNLCCLRGMLGTAEQAHLVGGARSLAALSVNTPLDRTDALALTPDGRLHLALTRDTHERLGLVGARSATSPGAPPYRSQPGCKPRACTARWAAFTWRSTRDMHKRLGLEGARSAISPSAPLCCSTSILLILLLPSYFHCLVDSFIWPHEPDRVGGTWPVALVRFSVWPQGLSACTPQPLAGTVSLVLSLCQEARYLF